MKKLALALIGLAFGSAAMANNYTVPLSNYSGCNDVFFHVYNNNDKRVSVAEETLNSGQSDNDFSFDSSLVGSRGYSILASDSTGRKFKITKQCEYNPGVVTLVCEKEDKKDHKCDIVRLNCFPACPECGVTVKK